MSSDFPPSKLFEESTVFKPFHYPWAENIEDEHARMVWHQSEVPLGDDVTDWKLGKLTDHEKEFVTQILRMFTQSDVNVGGYYYDYLIPRFKNNEIRNMLGEFAVREKVHQKSYSLLNETLGFPESVYNDFLKYKEMKDKHEFMLDADSSTLEGLALALAKGVLNEGVSLFASFVMLLNFPRFGKMKGMGKIVEFSIKDETVHVRGIAQLFRTLCAECPEIVTDTLKKSIYKMARKAVKLEDAFINAAYAGGNIEGLPAEDVKNYIRYITDLRLNQLGLKENFKIASNPLPWLDWIINAAQHTNFFENKVADYEVSGLSGEWEYPPYFTVFSKDGCPYCEKAKSLLDSLGMFYDIIDLTDDAERAKFYADRGFIGPEKTVPKIYEGDRLVGGYTDLHSELVNKFSAQ